MAKQLAPRMMKIDEFVDQSAEYSLLIHTFRQWLAPENKLYASLELCSINCSCPVDTETAVQGAP